MTIQRLTLPIRNIAGLNRRDARLMHIIPEKPMQIEPSRYNVKTSTGTAKLTLYEDRLDVVHLQNSGNGLVETARMSFKGSVESLAEKLAEMYNAVKFW